jgi:hypothetical protein
LPLQQRFGGCTIWNEVGHESGSATRGRSSP